MTRWVRFWLVVSGSLLMMSGCTSLSQQVGLSPKQLQDRQIIVALDEKVRAQWQAINTDILNHFDLQKVGEFPLNSIQVNCLVYRVSEMVEVEEVIRRLQADERIALVQTNQVFDGQGDQSTYGSLSYGPKAIHADLLHQHKITGKNIRVAVIDTGADTEHPDLKGQIKVSENFVENGEASFRDDRHGTAVAGIIAAHTDQKGIDGIAPDVLVNIYKACWYAAPNNPKALCSSWTLAKAIDAAIKADVRIINLSLGGPSDKLLKKLLLAAAEHNIVLVAATLENQADPGFPASMDSVIPVISSNLRGETPHPQWSNLPMLIAAPGIDILTTAPEGSYAFLSGSSLATAHVSGVIALLLQHQPSLTPTAIRTLLLNTGQTLGTNIKKIDACLAIASLGVKITCS